MWIPQGGQGTNLEYPPSVAGAPFIFNSALPVNGVVPVPPKEAGPESPGKEEAKEQEVRKEEEGGAACSGGGSGCSGGAGGCSSMPPGQGGHWQQGEAAGQTAGRERSHAGCQGDAQRRASGGSLIGGGGGRAGSNAAEQQLQCSRRAGRDERPKPMIRAAGRGRGEHNPTG